MITLPDFSKSMEYENNFYLSCDSSRLSKIISHYELYKLAHTVPGTIVECGVFKGTSLVRFAGFRQLLNTPVAHKIIGFDIFGAFPETNYKGDKKFRDAFINDAGLESISTEQLYTVLKQKGVDANVELVPGDITQTVPDYVAKHPELKIALLNLDVDIYEPSVTILEHLYPRLVVGGVLILDDYEKFPGEAKAVDDYFKGQHITIRKLPHALSPSYIIKETV